MVPITPCNVPLAGIVGVSMRTEGRSKALKEEGGRNVTYQVMITLTEILIECDMCHFDDTRDVCYEDLFNVFICPLNS